MKTAIYARYSTDRQRPESLEDQIEVCSRYVKAQGWVIAKVYTDAAISGASRFRPQFQALLQDAEAKRFDVVVCEAVDRLGRRLADTADLQDRLSFFGIRLFTPALGEVTAIHVAVMGMMAQMALKDLGEKTRRGQLGRVLKGRIAGGLAYGYRIVEGAEGGLRTIDADEADVVRRIYQEFAEGKSPEAIARDLNRENVPGPGGRPWSNTTIRGQGSRRTGLLNNGLYRGVLEWNRCSYVKDPRTGKRVARPNPIEAWEVREVPELRIVEQDLWDRVKARQFKVRPVPSPSTNPLNASHRPQFLLSGLLRCSSCGGGYTIVGKDRYGCATRRQKGTCANSRTIRRQEIEERVLGGLKDRLLAPDLVASFVSSVQEELNRARRQHLANASRRDKRRAEIDRKIGGLMHAIEDGLYEPAMKTRMAALRVERDALDGAPADAMDSHLDILTLPNLPDLYRRKVQALEQVLDSPDRAEALDLIRSMIDRVVLTPRKNAGGLEAHLHGDLAAILAACSEAQTVERPGAFRPPGRQLSVVAGASDQRYLRLWNRPLVYRYSTVSRPSRRDPRLGI